MKALVDGYRAGATVYDLAAQFGIHRVTVSQHLRRNGVAMRRQGLDEQQSDLAVHLYEQGQSLARVGATLGVNAGTVRQALLDRGIRMRAPWERNRRLAQSVSAG